MPNVKKVKIGSQELVREAMRELRAWQQDKTKPRSCPHCGAEGLEIIDRSARPFAEWYAFKCEACGLDDALQIPLASHRPPS